MNKHLLTIFCTSFLTLSLYSTETKKPQSTNQLKKFATLYKSITKQPMLIEACSSMLAPNIIEAIISLGIKMNPPDKQFIFKAAASLFISASNDTELLTHPIILGIASYLSYYHLSCSDVIELSVKGGMKSNIFKTHAPNIPIIGKYLACKNTQCSGSCDICIKEKKKHIRPLVKSVFPKIIAIILYTALKY
ncbi:MAG: hypothetical protein WDZ41_02225 [Candidatus Babeliales bacterium]